MSKNPQNWEKLMKIANIDREFLHIFWTTWENSMKFSGKMCFKIILKVTKNQGSTLSMEDTFFKKLPMGGGSIWPLLPFPPSPPRHIRVKLVAIPWGCLCTSFVNFIKARNKLLNLLHSYYAQRNIVNSSLFVHNNYRLLSFLFRDVSIWFLLS